MTGTKPIYLEWLRAYLHFNGLYSVARLVNILIAEGKLSDVDEQHRARLVLKRHALMSGFPEDGDALETPDEGAPLPAWTGERWLASA